MSGINTMQAETLMRKIADLQDRINKLDRKFIDQQAANAQAIDSVTHIGSQTISSLNTWEDLTGLTLTITVPRTTNILLSTGGEYYFAKNDVVGANAGYIQVAFNIDGVRPYDITAEGGANVYNFGSNITGAVLINGFSSFQYVGKLDAGTHIIKVQWMLTVTSGSLPGYSAYKYMNSLILAR